MRSLTFAAFTHAQMAAAFAIETEEMELDGSHHAGTPSRASGCPDAGPVI